MNALHATVMQQALNALEGAHKVLSNSLRIADAIEALRAALAQPQAQPEPVAWLIEYECRAGGMNRGGSLTKFDYVWHPHSFASVDRDATIDAETVRNKKLTPLYAAPQPPATEPAISADAYEGAREDLAIWKKRALEAEAINRKFIAEVNGPTHMGEPPIAQPAKPQNCGTSYCSCIECVMEPAKTIHNGNRSADLNPPQQEKSCATCVNIYPEMACHRCMPEYKNWRAAK